MCQALFLVLDVRSHLTLKALCEANAGVMMVLQIKNSGVNLLRTDSRAGIDAVHSEPAGEVLRWLFFVSFS